MILFVVLYLYTYVCVSNKENCIIYATTIWCTWLLLVTYGLSLIHSLNVYTVLGVELLFTLVVAMIICSTKPNILLSEFKTSISARIRMMLVDKVETGMFLVGILMFIVALWIAIVTEPYNWDSMTYHMARIANWAQNESVMPYATHIDRQVGSTTMAAYVCLYVYMLCGRQDILLGIVQCLAYGVDAYMVYAIAKKCGASKKYSILGSLLFMALPIAFAESATTQNDLFATMWLLFFLYLIIDYVDDSKNLRGDKESLRKTAYLAACLALGYLSKPSVCFAMVMALLWVLVLVIRRRDKLCVLVKMLIVGSMTCFAYVLPTWLINYSVWGKISPDNVGARQLIGTLEIKHVFINFLKNATYNLGNTIIPNFKENLGEFLYWISDAIGVNLDTESIAEDGSTFGYSSYPYGCDTALNPLCLTLALIAMIVLIFMWKKQEKLWRQYSLFAISSYTVFCCFLRWEAFISRYLVGYFAILCPMIVLQAQFVSDKMKKKWSQWIMFGLLILLIGSNYGLIISNYEKEKPGSYFYHQGDLRDEYEVACNEIITEQYSKIGLIVESNSYEYPLWGIMENEIGLDNLEIRHVLVDNALAKYEKIDFIPDCIFVVDGVVDKTIEYKGNIYVNRFMENEKRVGLYSLQEAQ